MPACADFILTISPLCFIAAILIARRSIKYAWENGTKVYKYAATPKSIGGYFYGFNFKKFPENILAIAVFIAPMLLLALCVYLNKA